MQQKFVVAIYSFPYGGNGATSSETPDIREWMVPLAVNLSKDPRIERIHIDKISSTPITMTRNRAVKNAKAMGADVLVMVDSDMKPDMYAGQPGVKPFFESSFDFLVDHYHKGPVVIGAPYGGPPPHECPYIFRWQNLMSDNADPDYQLSMYDRYTASKMSGIQECAALPTGLIMFDLRMFDLTAPKQPGDKAWFYYEYSDFYETELASTEDVTATRDMSLVGIQKLGYNPVFCNWDAWAGHWKPKCVGKPILIDAAGVSKKLSDAVLSGHDSTTKIVNITAAPALKRIIEAAPAKPEFDDMGLRTPEYDLDVLSEMVRRFREKYERFPKVCEVGSWAGASAIAMASAGAEVTCIDTWAGNKNDDGCDHYDGSRGTPFEVFLRNTKDYPGIKPLIMDSLKAATMFEDKSFDIVYLDAEHDEASVRADIAAWKPKTRYILAGHDHTDQFPGVKKAVADLLTVYQVEATVWKAYV